MNRLRQEQGDDSPRSIGVDHFVLSARSATWYVSTEMARHIEACLDAEPRAAWVSFVDQTGARVRLRSREVEYLAQSTADQRAADRGFHRTIGQERKADRNWDEDD